MSWNGPYEWDLVGRYHEAVIKDRDGFAIDPSDVVKLLNERTPDIGKLETALRQARFFIQELGPTGIDKDLTLRFIDMALPKTNAAHGEATEGK